MMQGQRPKISEFLSGLCRLSLEVLPFEGALIAMLNLDNSGLDALGGAGIFDLDKARHFLGNTDLSKPSKYFIPGEINRLLANGIGVKSPASPLIGEYSMPGAGRIGLVKDAEEAQREGLHEFEDIYKQGKHVHVPVALPLYQLNGSRGKVIGLFLLNNLITDAEISDAEISDDTQLLFPLLTSTLSAFVISRILSRQLEGEDQDMSLPTKEEFIKKIMNLAESGVVPSGLKLASSTGQEGSRKESQSPDEASVKQTSKNLVYLALTIVIGLATITLSAGLSAKVLWSLIGLLGGIVAGLSFLYKAHTTEEGLLARICFNTAGFVLLFEVALLLSSLVATR